MKILCFADILLTQQADNKPQQEHYLLNIDNLVLCCCQENLK